jgi:hypothetical protein
MDRATRKSAWLIDDRQPSRDRGLRRNFRAGDITRFSALVALHRSYEATDVLVESSELYLTRRHLDISVKVNVSIFPV